MKLFKFRMWKASWVILIGYLTLFILDIVSTLSVGKLVQYMETNPIFIKAGWAGLIAINILALWLLLKGFDSAKIHNRFLILTSFVYVSVIRVFVIINNFSLGDKVQSGEITEAMVQGTSEAARMNHYAWLIIFNLMAPIIFSMIIYFLFILDHKIEVQNE